jgi:transcriptional regulator GlxA family with amidase domain
LPQIAQLSSRELRESLNSRLLDDGLLKRLAYFPRAQRALAFAHDKLPASIRLDAVAAHVGMSSAAFSRYFAGKIGITFSYAVRALRIERALAELEKSDCTIESLACQNGYQSGCAFTRAFKEVVGETPSEYRRRLLA